VKKYWRQGAIVTISIPYLLLMQHTFTTNNYQTAKDFSKDLLSLGVLGIEYFGYWFLIYIFIRAILTQGLKKVSTLIVVGLLFLLIAGFQFILYLSTASDRQIASHHAILSDCESVFRKVLNQSPESSKSHVITFSQLIRESKYIPLTKTTTAYVPYDRPDKVIDCASPQWRCLEIYGGGSLAYELTETLNPSEPTSVIRLIVAPQSSPPTQAPSILQQLVGIKPSQPIALYVSANGHFYTDATLPPNAHSNLRPYPRHPDQVPDWAKGWQPQPLQ
jgi:hypothetical protein